MVRKLQVWSLWIVCGELLVGAGFGTWFLGRPAKAPKLVEAVRQVESGGSEQKVGDRKLKHKAYTSLQIRQPALDDVNLLYQREIKKLFGQKKLTIAYLKQNRAALDWVFDKYTGYYATWKRLGREPTDEDRARIWNGGPNGWGKKATKKYGQKVLASL